MATYLEKFFRLLKTLNEHAVDYILIGGLAMIIHGFNRFTSDVDLFIRNTPENIDKLKMALRSLYDDPAIDEITLEELTQYPVIRYGTPDDFYIDMMIRLGEAFNFDNLNSEIVEYQGIEINVATLESLYLLKKDTLREKDQLDLLFLKKLNREKR